jgi:hypothetical protein
MAEKIRQAEGAFLDWLATTRTGSFFKVALGAILVWAADAAASWEIPPAVMVALVAVIPVIINELNSHDDRYGARSDKKQ